MTDVPRAALWLGLAGLIPFVWGALTVIEPSLGDRMAPVIGPRFVGPYVSLAYGTVILAFMSGVLWGFATRTEGRAASIGYGVSVVPALWAFLFVGGGPAPAAAWLSAGFAGLLALDWVFWRARVAPPWWMRLRILLTAIVLVALAPLWLRG